MFCAAEEYPSNHCSVMSTLQPDTLCQRKAVGGLMRDQQRKAYLGWGIAGAETRARQHGATRGTARKAYGADVLRGK